MRSFTSPYLVTAVAKSFKIRLPHPIRLQGSSWKVGLISMSLTDVKVHLPKLVDGNEILFTRDWIMKYPSGALKFGRAHDDPNDLRAMVEYIDGVGFMKSMVTLFGQRRILNYQGPHLGSSYTASNGKRMYVKFRWDGDDLLTDNKSTHVRSNYSPALKINKMFALKMGSLKERSPENYDLRPNLRQEFFTDTVPNLETMTHDLKNNRGEPLFCLIREDLFHLSVTCDWPFKMWWVRHQVPCSSFPTCEEVQWLEIKSRIYCERSIIDGQGMEVIILNRSTFSIFRCARTCWTLLRHKCRRQTNMKGGSLT